MVRRGPDVAQRHYVMRAESVFQRNVPLDYLGQLQIGSKSIGDIPWKGVPFGGKARSVQWSAVNNGRGDADAGVVIKARAGAQDRAAILIESVRQAESRCEVAVSERPQRLIRFAGQ